jgi:predicted site-specific integrase-resolvase
MLSVTTTTIHNYIKAGSLDARKIGGRWFVSEETIKSFVSGSNGGSAGKGKEE